MDTQPDYNTQNDDSRREPRLFPGHSLFLPMTPNVEVVRVETSIKHLLEALLTQLSRGDETVLLIGAEILHVEWRGLWFLNEPPHTWPNPLTIQIMGRLDEDKREEIGLVEIQELSSNASRLAFRFNRNLMSIPGIAQGITFQIRAWLSPWIQEDDPATSQDIATGNMMTLAELQENVLSKYQQESVAWWRALATWYWAGGREHLTSQDSLAEELGLPSVDTLQRRFREYRPSAEN